jgi:hypothetical protein
MLTVTRALHTWVGFYVQFLQNRDYHSSCTERDVGLTHADVVDALAATRRADDRSLRFVFTVDEERGNPKFDFNYQVMRNVEFCPANTVFSSN